MAAGAGQFGPGRIARRPVPVCAVPKIGAAEGIARAARERRKIICWIVNSIAVGGLVPVPIKPIVASLIAAEFGHGVGEGEGREAHRWVALESNSIIDRC